MNEITPLKNNKTNYIVLSILAVVSLTGAYIANVYADNQSSTDYETIVAEVENNKKEKSKTIAYLSGQISAELISVIEDEESLTQEKVDALVHYRATHKKLIGSKKKLSDYLEKGNTLLGK